jgi:hypothetical protein
MRHTARHPPAASVGRAVPLLPSVVQKQQGGGRHARYATLAAMEASENAASSSTMRAGLSVRGGAEGCRLRLIAFVAIPVHTTCDLCPTTHRCQVKHRFWIESIQSTSTWRKPFARPASFGTGAPYTVTQSKAASAARHVHAAKAQARDNITRLATPVAHRPSVAWRLRPTFRGLVLWPASGARRQMRPVLLHIVAVVQPVQPLHPPLCRVRPVGEVLCRWCCDRWGESVSAPLPLLLPL